MFNNARNIDVGHREAFRRAWPAAHPRCPIPLPGRRYSCSYLLKKIVIRISPLGVFGKSSNSQKIGSVVYPFATSYGVYS